MIERDLYPAILRGALLSGWPLYRLNDGSPGRKPFDFGGATPTGEAVGLEVKVVPTVEWNEPMVWRRFEVQQRQWLHEYARRPRALALVGLYEEALQRLTVVRLVCDPELRLDLDSRLRDHRVVPMRRVTSARADAFMNWELLP